MAKPSADGSSPIPIPSSLSTSTKKSQKKLSASLLLSSSQEEQTSTPLSPSSIIPTVPLVLPSTGVRKQSFPSISEQTSTNDGGNNDGGNMKMWGSIEQLQAADSEFPPSEMGKDSQWSMVERGTIAFVCTSCKSHREVGS